MMKTIIKTLAFLLVVSIGSYTYGQTDTTKSTADNIKDKVEGIFESEHDVDHNHDALKKDVDDMVEILNKMEFTGNFDADYANIMLEFLETGIDLGRAQIMHGNNDALKEKARKTNEWQDDQIEDLRAFLRKTDTPDKNKEESPLKADMQKKLDELHAIRITGDIDKDYAKLMTKYHQYVIDFSKMELQKGQSAELKQIAQHTIEHQQQAIDDLKQWVK